MSYDKEIEIYKGYIYKITNLVNGKSYIGQTIRTIEERWKQHVKDSNSNKDDFYLHRAIRKYGKENFVIEEIFSTVKESIFELKEELNDHEKYYIKLFNTYNPDGYNMTLGGEGVAPKLIVLYSYDGLIISEFNSMTEASEICNISMGEISGCCYGKRLGTRCGVFRFVADDFNKYPVIYRPDGRLKINKFDINGNLLYSYSSITEAAKEYGATKTSITRWCKSHKYIDNSFVLFYDTEIFDKNVITYPSYRRVAQYDLNGNFIKLFKNASEAARSINGDPSAITKCCNNKLYKYKQHVWRFEGDSFDTNCA